MVGAEVALQDIVHMDCHSRLERRRNVAEVEWSNIEINSILGRGSFGIVYEIVAFAPELKGKRYALKCLNQSTMSSPKSFAAGASDLVLEAAILSRLDHGNIIKLHGVASGCVARSFTHTERGYFLLLDVLKDTLDDRLQAWRKKTYLKRLGESSRANVLSRIEQVAVGVAKGMHYLHLNNVVLRDLKPENVGFDEEGTVKLLDFGFARELHMLQANEIAGSLRYMSPELMSRDRQTTKASDVYSFGVLLWQLCTLKIPFSQKFKTPELFKEHVVNQYRPSVRSIPSTTLKQLVTACWDNEPEKRPSFSTILSLLQVEVSHATAPSMTSSHSRLVLAESFSKTSQSCEFHTNDSMPLSNLTSGPKGFRGLLKGLCSSSTWKRSRSTTSCLKKESEKIRKLGTNAERDYTRSTSNASFLETDACIITG
jgi:serine/threonine protein kinase